MRRRPTLAHSLVVCWCVVVSSTACGSRIAGIGGDPDDPGPDPGPLAPSGPWRVETFATPLEVVAGSLVDNSYTELEGSVVAHWVATGKSTLDGRVGYTARRHDQVPERDFDGATGRLAYGWFIGAKTLLDFSAWREIQSTEDVSASYILAQGWGIGPAWAPTVKLVFQAKYVREDRDYRGDPGIALSGTPEREDTFRGIAVAAGQPFPSSVTVNTCSRGSTNSW